MNGEVKTRRLVFSGDRERVRFRAVRTALNWLRMEIQVENKVTNQIK